MSSSDDELVVRDPFKAASSGGERRSSRRAHISRRKETQNKALEEMRRARAAGLVHRVDVRIVSAIQILAVVVVQLDLLAAADPIRFAVTLRSVVIPPSSIYFDGRH
uniref:IBB domain-containing protein n=1 Tax=Parascaris equorum TaxID=6256 RepID=A0A914R3R4_PAREQ